MPVIWPPTLPQYPSSEGYEETYANSVLQSGMSIGRKSRLVDANVFKFYNVKLLVGQDDKDTIRGFWASSLRNGTLPFDWTKFDDGTTTHSYRMLSDPEFSPTAAGIWKVSLRLCDDGPQRVIDTTIVPADTSWPSDLPDFSEVSGFREVWNGYSLRSNISAGQTSRFRSTFTDRRISVTMMMTLAQKQSFESFYEDDLVLGSRTFTHDGWSDDFTSVRYALMSPPKFTSKGAGIFTLSIEMGTV